MKNSSIALLALCIALAERLASGAQITRSSIQFQEAVADAPPGVRQVAHDKEAGGGYKEGSPLYAKQEARDKYMANKPWGFPWGQLGEVQEIPQDIQSLSTGYLLRSVLWSWLTLIIWMLLLAAIYQCIKKPATPETQPIAQYDGDSFSYGLCDLTHIGEDWFICLSAFCCPFVRWADTMSSRKGANAHLPFVGNFWLALGLVLVVMLVAYLGTIGMMVSQVYLMTGQNRSIMALYYSLGLLAACGPLILLVYGRQHLRKAFQKGYGKPIKVLEDCCVYCWCGCCAIVQEAREMDKVMYGGGKILAMPMSGVVPASAYDPRKEPSYAPRSFAAPVDYSPRPATTNQAAFSAPAQFTGGPIPAAYGGATPYTQSLSYAPPSPMTSQGLPPSSPAMAVRTVPARFEPNQRANPDELRAWGADDRQRQAARRPMTQTDYITFEGTDRSGDGIPDMIEGRGQSGDYLRVTGPDRNHNGIPDFLEQPGSQRLVSTSSPASPPLAQMFPDQQRM